MRNDTTDRMRERTRELIAGFPGYVEAFAAAGLFTGPSMYFHLRTLERLRRCGSPGAAIDDDPFVELLYATLASWGMHRMGPGGAKLVEFGVFRDSLRMNRDKICGFGDLSIGAVTDVEQVTTRLWDLISSVRVSASETRIVAGSKAIHHLLPDLVPPIDRQYTIRFFLHSTTMSQGDEPVFRAIYPMFVRIAVACNGQIGSLIGPGMNTSDTKIIDNAIVGYVRQHMKSGIEVVALSGGRDSLA